MPTGSGRSVTLEDGGFIVLAGSAIGYDDLQVSASAAKLPASSAPTWTTFDFNIPGGVEFNVLGFGIGEYQDLYIQTSHRQKLNTILDNHIHWTIPSDSASDKIKFQLDVIAAGINEAFAVPPGSPFTSEHTLSGDESGGHKLLDLADIPAVNTTPSTIYIARLTRIAASSSDYSSDVYILFNDSHYMIDTPAGSRQEGSK